MMTAPPALAVLGVLAFTAGPAGRPGRARLAARPRRWAAVLPAKAATAGAVVFAAAGWLASLTRAARAGPQ
jgi:hypothetical protein